MHRRDRAVSDFFETDFSQMEEFGISGTRFGTSEEQHLALKLMIETLHNSGLHIMHHGKCKGVDSEAHMMAHRLKASGMKVVIHPPIKAGWRNDDLPVDHSWVKELPPREYWERDRDIAMISSVLLIAPLSDDPTVRSGTLKTAGYARRYGRLVFWADRQGNIHDVTEAPNAST